VQTLHQAGVEMIDWGHVRELHREIGAHCFDEVQHMFLDEVGVILTRLRKGVDGSTLGADLHALKGSVITLGFVEVARLCQEGEVLFAMGRGSQVDVDGMVQAYEDTLDQFLAQRDQHLA
jgi:histidine phosphotransfer protein HptB